MTSIFISYRREDSGGDAGRICDRLNACFGDARVFMDVEDIQPGQNFAQSIDETIKSCDCVIAIIGPHWLETLQQRAQGIDYVRHELAAALSRKVTVIPVLVAGARMPAADQLPADLSALSLLNALEVRHERFDDDVVRLDEFLRKLGFAGRSSSVAAVLSTRAWWVLIPALVLAATIAAFVSFRPATSSAPPGSVAPDISLDGSWSAEMQKPGQRPFRIRLTLITAGNNVTGMVQYPTGDGEIHEGRLAGRVLTFYTSHVPQFESAPVEIRCQAEVIGEEIKLTTTDAGGVATGVAKRTHP